MRRDLLKHVSFKVVLWYSFCPCNFNFKCGGEEQLFLALQYLGFVKCKTNISPAVKIPPIKDSTMHHHRVMLCLIIQL